MVVVLVLALTGVTLAALVALAPWYGAVRPAGAPGVVEMYAPAPAGDPSRASEAPAGRSGTVVRLRAG